MLFTDCNRVGLLLRGAIPPKIVDKELRETKLLDVFEIEVSHVFSLRYSVK